jgi:hypothetical protein
MAYVNVAETKLWQLFCLPLLLLLLPVMFLLFVLLLHGPHVPQHLLPGIPG